MSDNPERNPHQTSVPPVEENAPLDEAAATTDTCQSSAGEARVPRLKVKRIALDKKISPYFAT